MYLSESISTRTYEYDKKLLSEYGQIAQISKVNNFNELKGSLMLGIRPELSDIPKWLHDNSSLMSRYAVVAELSASIRTHPRHLMDASRLMCLDVRLKNELEELASKMLKGESLLSSSNLNDLAKEAIEIIKKDSRATENEINDWANILSIDCFGRND